MSSLTQLARRSDLHSTVNGDTDIRALFDALRRGEPYERLLLIFDGATAPGELVDLIPEHGHIIVTSRHQEWAHEGRRVHFQVNPFTPEESIDLLARCAPRLPSDQARQVAKRLGHHPMALVQAGEWLTAHTDRGPSDDPALADCGSSDDPVRDYLDLLTQQATDVDESSPTDSLGVRLATALTLNQLARYYPASHRLLELCAFLSPKGIGAPLLKSPAIGRLLTDVDKDYRTGRIPFGQVRHQITRYSLARLDHHSEQLVVHELVQELVRAAMSEEHQHATQVTVRQALAAFAPGVEESDEPRHDHRYAELARHLNTSGALGSDDDDVRRWLVLQVRYHYRTGTNRRARDIGRELFDAWTDRFGERDPLRLRLGAQLSNAYRELGDYQTSHQLTTSVLRLQREDKSLGPTHPTTLSTQASHGADLRAKGQFGDAFATDQATHTSYGARLGDSDHRTLLTAHNLALSLAVQGSPSEALVRAENALAAYRELRGDDTWWTWNMVCTVGMFKRHSGAYSESVGRLREGISHLRRLTGDRSVSVQLARTELAASLRLFNEPESALVEVSAAREGIQAHYDDPHNPHALVCANELAACHAAVGAPDQALHLARETLQGYADNAFFGEDHPFTNIVRSNTAAYAELCGSHDEALSGAKRAWRSLTDHPDVGPTHPFTLAATVNYANVLVAVGKYEEALSRDNEAHQGYRTLFGPAHYFSELSMTNTYDSMARYSGNRPAGSGERGRIVGEIPLI